MDARRHCHDKVQVSHGPRTQHCWPRRWPPSSLLPTGLRSRVLGPHRVPWAWRRCMSSACPSLVAPGGTGFPVCGLVWSLLTVRPFPVAATLAPCLCCFRTEVAAGT